MKNLFYLIGLVLVSCSGSRNVASFNSFADANIYPRKEEIINETTYSISFTKDNGGPFSIHVMKNKSQIGRILLGYSGAIYGLESSKDAETHIFNHSSKNSGIKVICFSMIYDKTSDKNSFQSKWNGYVFVFDKSSVLKSIYLCDKNKVLKDVYVRDPSQKKEGSILGLID